MGGGLLQLVGVFKKPSQPGPNSTGQYCTSNTAPDRTMLSCNPPSSSASASPVGLFLPVPHPSTLIRQQCDRYLQEADATCAQSNAFQGTCHHKQDIHWHRHTCNYVRPAYPPTMTAPSPASTHSRSTPPVAIAGNRLLTLNCVASHALGTSCEKERTDPR